jgi:hypothetical protein
VIGFSTFGYLTYIFSKAYEEGSTMIGVFRKYFPLVVLPQVLMLGYAIAVRILQYDLTMNRYFVVIFGLWLTIISLYLIISRRKSLAIIAASLTLLSLLISVGPWSVYSFPVERQHARLIQNLETAKILQDGQIQKLDHSIEMTLENDIYSGIQYICDFSECDRMKSLFAKEIESAEKESLKNWNESPYNSGKTYPGISKWEVTNAVTTAIGISYRYNASAEEEIHKYLSFSVTDVYKMYDPDILFPLDTTGYDRIVKVYSDGTAMNTSGMRESISVNVDTAKLLLYR